MKPKPSNIPLNEYWSFVQRDCETDNELIPLAKNIIKYNNQQSLNNSDKILSFLAVPEGSKKGYLWSGLWITIVQMLGLAYTTREDKILHKTRLAEYVANGNSVTNFYLYWALRFQFPFAEGKHRAYKELGIAIQPIVSILEHLVLIFNKALFNNKNSIDMAYLTYDEIILVLMKSRSNSIYEVMDNVNHILANRARFYNYEDLKDEGYNKIFANFSGRARLYLQRIDLIKFDADRERIFIANWNHYYKILVFLAYRRKAYIITTDGSSRIEYFEQAFNNLDPDPDCLHEAIQSISSDEGLGGIDPDMLERTSSFLLQNGIYFKKDLVEAFLLSIKTKPFVIISGISGVGKTLLPRSVMKMIGNEECRPIAVAPDWTDNSDMLGYFDVEGKFIIGEFTKLVLEANDKPHVPFFIILDEMNLSRVEYYFAQVLSVIESRYFDDELNRVEYQDYLFNKAIRQRLLESAINGSPQAETLRKIAELRISNNVYIIGTVNIDESTYPFSKKVLDRANVLEINDIDLKAGIIDAAETEAGATNLEAINDLFVGRITNLKELKIDWSLNEDLNRLLPLEKTLNQWADLLAEFNNILKNHRLNFGYRVRDEVCIYLYYAACQQNPETLENPDWWHKYFDQQLVQKVLTRFSGEQGEIENTIIQLINLSTATNYTEEDISGISKEEIIRVAKFPKAAIKLKLMLDEIKRLNRPSTSFWVVQQ